MLCQYANFADRTGGRQFGWNSATSCDDGALYTVPVGGYQPNGFGLHDMHGNVLEWTEDCYHDSYAGAPSDGDARTAGDCAQRVFRGGSWAHQPGWVGSSTRHGSAPDARVGTRGFRLLQDPTEAPSTPTTLPSVGGQPPVVQAEEQLSREYARDLILKSKKIQDLRTRVGLTTRGRIQGKELARISHQCVDTWAKGIDEDLRKVDRLN